MKNYWRVVRLALRYRWAIVCVFVTSVIVGVLWGGTIGALYPVIKVILRDKPLQVWIADEMQSAEDRVSELRTEIVRLDRRSRDLPGRRPTADASRNQEWQRLRNSKEFELRAEHRALARYQAVQPWVDRLPTGTFQTVIWIVFILLVATTIKCLFLFWNAVLVARLRQRVAYDLQRSFFHQCLRMDQHAFHEERAGSLMSHFHADIRVVSDSVNHLFGRAILEPLKIISCLIGAAFVSWQILLVSLMLTPVTAYLFRQLAGSLKRANRRALEEQARLFGVLSESFASIRTVQAFTLERLQRKHYYEVARRFLDRVMRIAYYRGLTKPLTEILGVSVICFALLCGVYVVLERETHIFGIRVTNRPLDVEALLVFYGLLIGAVEPARKLTGIFNALQAGRAAADRLYPIMDRRPSIASPANPRAMPALIEEIVFGHVDFYYTSDQPVLSDVDLTIHAGETIAIVGSNGCGKSTLANLVPRFYDPSRGSVRMNGIDVRQLPLQPLRRRIGMVSQQTPLLDDTVYNNILHGNLAATETEVHEAAALAHAHRFILDQLEDGYDTIVGTGGMNLSSGQRQRVALARAMLRNSDVLILDEATSQVDLESEQLIHQALEQFSKGRIAIIITHRLATLALADRIVVMDAGRIIDAGTHGELMDRCQLYCRLYETHYRRTA